MTAVFFSACSGESVRTGSDRSPASIPPKDSYKVRFQVEPSKWDGGVRFAEYRTTDIDVTYKISKADPYNLIFKVYVSNVGKKNLRIDSSLFNITSLNTKKLFTAQNSYWADEKKPVVKVSLAPGESASSELKFAVNDPRGRWVLKNKLTDHSFNFFVAE